MRPSSTLRLISSADLRRGGSIEHVSDERGLVLASFAGTPSDKPASACPTIRASVVARRRLVRRADLDLQTEVSCSTRRAC